MSHSAWNKGLKGCHSEQSNLKRSKTLQGRKFKLITKKRMGIARKRYWKKLKKYDIKKYKEMMCQRSKVRLGKKIHTKEFKLKVSKMFKGKKHTLKSRKKLSETRKRLFKEGKLIGVWKGKHLPKYIKTKISLFNKNKIVSNNTKHKLSIQAKKRFMEHPEKHPNIIMAKKGFISFPQKQLYNDVLSLNKSAVLEYPVKTKNHVRYIDVAIPNLKMAFEYDGEQWHKDKMKDLKRDRELKEVGWKVFRFNKNTKFEKEVLILKLHIFYRQLILAVVTGL